MKIACPNCGSTAQVGRLLRKKTGIPVILIPTRLVCVVIMNLKWRKNNEFEIRLFDLHHMYSYCFGRFLFGNGGVALFDYVGIDCTRLCFTDCLVLGVVRHCLVDFDFVEKFV